MYLDRVLIGQSINIKQDLEVNLSFVSRAGKFYNMVEKNYILCGTDYSRFLYWLIKG